MPSVERVAPEIGWAELIFKVFETVPELLVKIYIFPAEIFIRYKFGESVVVRSALPESGETTVVVSLIFFPL